jgi:hypothetical protein
MKRHLVSTLAATLLVLLWGATPLLAQGDTPPKEDANWSTIYPVFAWLPLYGLDWNLPSGAPCTDCPAGPATGDASNSGLSGAWFAGGRLEMGRFELLGNYNYAGLSAEKESPLFRADVKLYTASILGGVRVYGPLFLEAGARYYGLHARLDVLTFPRIDYDPGRWSPAVGATFRPALSKGWRLYTHVDWGGLGTDEVSTVNGEARVEWRPISHLAITAGYGFGKVTFDDTIRNRPIHLSQTLHGPIVGFGIPF